MKAPLIAGALVVFVASLFLVACGSTPPTPSPTASVTAEKKEPVLYTGKNCFSQMTNAAIRWQPDALPVHLESDVNTESTGQEGKSTVWRAMFASPARGSWRSFTCSGSRLNDSPALGVTGSPESASSPEMSQAMFQSLLLIVDSDKAYAMAQENGGAGILKKNPQQPVLYSVDWDARNRQLVWAVMYGTSHADSKGVGIIDATSGKFLRAAK
jgi:hypothetical protein